MVPLVLETPIISKKHPFHQKEHTKRQIFFQTTPNSLDSIRSVGVLGMQPLKLRVRCLSVKWVSETRGRVSTPWKQFPRRGPFKRGKGNSWRSKKSTHPLKITHTHEEKSTQTKKKNTPIQAKKSKVFFGSHSFWFLCWHSSLKKKEKKEKKSLQKKILDTLLFLGGRWEDRYLRSLCHNFQQCTASALPKPIVKLGGIKTTEKLQLLGGNHGSYES